ncbi:exonuclease 1 [Aristolochia californica]|uniref:exonuclease 1 n=1 Tax=Aristolochia californica TaxID=171875 RepID=UPI0035D71D64
MGIHGLLPLLKSIMTPIDVKDLRGCTVAVDTYSWLHKGALSCSKELCTGQSTSRHIDYCMHRVNLLRHHGVKPILVFDGGLLPMKNDQEVKRLRTRKENLERAFEHESAGNFAAAYECYQKAVDISPAIAFELIQVLKQVDVDFVVAPYEADAQMTFLSLNKLVDAVITEDSDLIPFGCSRIIFKMDKFGQGVEFQHSMLQKNRELNFTGFTKQMLLEMCILSGCDYIQSLPGMGLKRAHALVRKLRSYDKVIKHLKYSAVLVPPSYEETFKKALWTFLYQRVYDPIRDDIVHLTEIHHDVNNDLDFLGPLIPQKVARGIARGELDPFSKLPFQGESICTTNYAVKEFKNESRRKMLDLPAQKNVLTNYFCVASSGAKMKFKAPRAIYKSDPDSTEESSPDTDGYVSNLSCLTEEDSPSTINNTRESFPSSTISTDHQSFTDSRRNRSEHVYTKQSRNQTSDPLVSLREANELNFVSHPKDGKAMAAKKKVIVRSSYFQRNSLDNDEQENNENLESVVTGEDRSKHVKPECMKAANAVLGSSYFRSDLKRRKSVPVQSESTLGEVSTVKHTEVNRILSKTGDEVPDTCRKAAETVTEEGKFGCNISHLGTFSDISEKSMDRFVSVISSFTCVTSGSRASGLRAPLKDVHNTRANGLTMPPQDFGKFSYVHDKKKKRLSISHLQ